MVDYYGPTEATVFATCRIVDAEAHRRPASIGTPIDGCEAFILDADDRPCHGDRPGELNLAGVCLAREYLRDPDMTARRFHYCRHCGAGSIVPATRPAGWPTAACSSSVGWTIR